MRLDIPIDPSTIPTAQEKGVRILKVKGKSVPMFYKAAALKAFEKQLSDYLTPLYPRLRIPEGKAAYVHITYLFPYPKSTPKRDRIDMARMIRRPDGDNLSKALIDNLCDLYRKDKTTKKWYVSQRRFIPDDGAVNPLVISKFRTTKEPKVVVTIRVQEDNPNLTLTQPLPNPYEGVHTML